MERFGQFCIFQTYLIVDVDKRVFWFGQKSYKIVCKLIFPEQFLIMEADQLRHIRIGVVELTQIVPHGILVVLRHSLISLDHGLYDTGKLRERAGASAFAAFHQIVERFDFRRTVQHIRRKFCPNVIDIVDVRCAYQRRCFIEWVKRFLDFLLSVGKVQNKCSVLPRCGAVETGKRLHR